MCAHERGGAMLHNVAEKGCLATKTIKYKKYLIEFIKKPKWHASRNCFHTNYKDKNDNG